MVDICGLVTVKGCITCYKVNCGCVTQGSVKRLGMEGKDSDRETAARHSTWYMCSTSLASSFSSLLKDILLSSTCVVHLFITELGTVAERMFFTAATLAKAARISACRCSVASSLFSTHNLHHLALRQLGHACNSRLRFRSCMKLSQVH